MILSLACGAGSILKAIPGIPPTPSTGNLPIGSSALSGDWNARTKFGQFAFTVDPNGDEVTTAVVTINDFRCGGTTLTTQSQVLDSWTIDGGEFSGDVNLGEADEILYITFNGTYKPSRKTFSGTWNEDANGTDCMGDWTTSPHQ